MKESLKELLDKADAILLGAGAGLSTAAGFEYGGKTFMDNFPWMHEKYGYTDMYSAGFHPFSSSEEKWGYWSKFIYLNRYKEGAKPLYKKLYSLVKNKDYFVLTTNVDHQFQLAGFSKDRLFYTQGDYGLFQCSEPCHDKTYDNKEAITRMISQAHDGMIPTSLIPHCPICGKEMTTNLRSDDTFVEDEGWHKASEAYSKFVSSHTDKKLLLLELGVGWNTPGIIKYPFMRLTYQFQNVRYCVINNGQVYIPDEIKEKSLVITRDINEVIDELSESK